MSAAKYDLIIEQGVTFRRQFKLTDANAAAVDLTGSTLRGQIRAYHSSPTVLGSFTFDIPDQTVAENTGVFFANMTATVTSSLPGLDSKNPGIQYKELSYDIERVLPDNSIQRLLNGVVRVSPEVTRE